MYPTPLDTSAGKEDVVLRLVPTPDWDPPYDDPDVAQPRRAVLDRADQPVLDLTFVLANAVPALPAAPRLRLVPTGAGAGASPDATPRLVSTRGDLDDDEAPPRPTPTSELPDARGWAGRLAIAAVEVMAGTRPLPQLRRWTSDEVYGQLRRHTHTGRVSERRRAPQPEPPALLPVTRVRAVRVCEPGDGLAEASVVVDDGRRVRALALRLEGVDGRWRCTELHTP